MGHKVSDPIRQLEELAPPHRPSGRRDVGATRQRILDVARALFCSQGYDRTPLRAISDSLGVTKAALYYYFRAKDDLLVAIVGPLLDRIDDMLNATDPTLPSRPGAGPSWAPTSRNWSPTPISSPC